jgi:hypothetical protein
MRLKKSFAFSCLPVHIAAENGDVYDTSLPCSDFEMHFGSDDEVAFCFDCCSVLAVVRHDLLCER